MKDFKRKLTIGLSFITQVSKLEGLNAEEKQRKIKDVRGQVFKIFRNLTDPYVDAAISNRDWKRIQEREPWHRRAVLRTLAALTGIGRDLRSLLPWDSSFNKESGSLWWLKRLTPRTLPFIGSDSLRTSAVRQFSRDLRTSYLEALEVHQGGDSSYLESLEPLMQQLESAEPMTFSGQNKFVITLWAAFGVYFGVIDQVELAWFRTGYGGVPTMIEWMALSGYIMRARLVNSGAVFARTMKKLAKKKLAALSCKEALKK